MTHTQASPTVERLVAWSIQHPLSLATRILIATLLMALCAAIRAALITDLLPWLLFMPVALLIGLTMGKRTGIYAVLLSSLLAAASIAPAGAAYWLTGAQWIASLLFILVSSAQVVVAAELRSSLVRSGHHAEERERIHELLIRKEEQTQLLNYELGHRLKNLLAIVQAVAGQTLRQSPDLATANDALSFRLAAFGRAADVLTANAWEPADLHVLARTALANHHSLADRFRLDGPPIRFKSQVALALALAFHELATNAIKYGALSNGSGHVDLRWSVEPGANPGEDRFSLVWREVGGPPVREPSRRGFGSVMIERSLRSYFRGTTVIHYEPDGLVFRIDAPLGSAQVEERA